MLCPYCNHDESNVLESRDAYDGKATRRRRECLKCFKRFTTYEKLGNIELKVVKKDGRVEDYQREKLEKCFERALWRVGEEDRLKMIDQIEMKLLNWESVEIPTKEIATLVMDVLKSTDPVAYVRFATIYLDIKNIEDYKKIINSFDKK
ncbi:MAG: transcriptional regulator NrdR [Microgenomates group bacterium]